MGKLAYVILIFGTSHSKLTSNNDIQDQDDKTDYTTTAAILPCIAMSSGSNSLLSESEGEQGKLQKESKCGLHDCEYFDFVGRV